jgi:hypothetical protein
MATSFKRPLCGPAPVVVFFETPDASKSLISKLLSGFIDREVEDVLKASDVVCVGCSPFPTGFDNTGSAIGRVNLGFARCRNAGFMGRKFPD